MMNKYARSFNSSYNLANVMNSMKTRNNKLHAMV